MEKRILGRTGLNVSLLGYGAMALRQIPVPGPSADTSNQGCIVLNSVLDAGINLIDTSPDYGNSEEILGSAVAHRRSEYVLATKCGCNVPLPTGADPPGHLWTKDRLMRNIELSLKRMRTDYIDIWQLHNADPESVRNGDLVNVMEEVKRQGKIRHVSISSTLPYITEYIDWGVFDTFQIPYSALERGHEETITRAHGAGAGIIIRGGVAKGEPQGDIAEHPRWSIWQKANLDELRADGESRSAFLLRFTISHPHMHTTIVGTKNPDHLRENLAAVANGPLPADVYSEAKHRLDAADE